MLFQSAPHFSSEAKYLANVGKWVNVREILARIEEESERGRSPGDRREFSIFLFHIVFSWPFDSLATIITPLSTHQAGSPPNMN